MPAPSIEGRRAFLWVPPECRHVRGLVVAVQNMLEQPLFERPAFRAACAENDLGLMIVLSGHDKALDDDQHPDHPKRSALDIFLNPSYPKGGEDPQGAGEDLQKVLDALAAESGYDEIRNAPLCPVGHSSAGSFVWHLYRWDASRIFAMMPFKTGAKDDGPEGIPILDVNSEWFEYGTNDMHNVSLATPEGGAESPRARSQSAKVLYGYYVDVGSGHCDVGDDAIPIMALFLKKAVAARIPADASMTEPVKLRPVDLAAGWVLDRATFAKPEGKPIAWTDWKGDAKDALWYLDRELAATIQSHMAAQLAKKPQQIGFMKDEQISTDARMFNLTPKFIDDAGTFKVQAAYVDHIDHANFNREHPDYYPPESKLGHSSSPILYRVNSGGVVQVGPDLFRTCPHAGPIPPQGNPWEPTIVAYNRGDETYRPTEHPLHVNVNITNTAGNAQTLEFPKLPDQTVNNLRPLKLRAKSSAGLPVEFFVVSGPVRIDGDTLRFDRIPIRSKLPVRVLVAAFQWGRPVDPKVASAGPEVQEFFIRE